MKWMTSVAAVLALAALMACQPSLDSASPAAGTPSPAKPAAANSAPITLTGSPQPKLRTIKLFMGTVEVVAEQALSNDQIARGMMFRKEMGEMEGMLFVFSAPHRTSFWMRNTLLPLTCAYIDPEGVILEIRDMRPLDETPLLASSDRIQYVLEMNQGWFERHKITTNMLIRTERGSLRETYFGN